MSLITPELLREAATYLSPGFHDHGIPFMCFCVDRAASPNLDYRTDDEFLLAYEARKEFERMLDEHLVVTWGNLRYVRAGEDEHRPFDDEAEYVTEAKQAARFDFLNLLACSMED